MHKPIFEVIGYDKASHELPQAVNCIDYFRKRLLTHLSEELNKKVWIAGGAIRDYFTDGTVSKDIDFFCVDRSSMAELIKVLRNKVEFKHYMITRNAIKGYGFIYGKKVLIDIVKKPFTDATSCIDAFDFTVCQFALNYETFFYHKSAIFDLIRKRLVVHAMPAPVDSMKRLQKYVKKGFTACNGTLLTIAKSISELDTTNSDLFEFYKFD